LAKLLLKFHQDIVVEKLEVEKRYLVELPSSWRDLASMFDGLVDVKRIKQIYLRPDSSGISSRIRKTVQGLLGKIQIVYHANQKEFVEAGVHKETEHQISKEEYEKALEKRHPDKVVIEKTRFVFNYHDQCFELDLFKGALGGLAILELELSDQNQKVELPPFLKVIEEITEDRRFSNFQLATKELHK